MSETGFGPESKVDWQNLKVYTLVKLLNIDKRIISKAPNLYT